MKKILLIICASALLVLAGCKGADADDPGTQTGHLHTYEEQYSSATCTEDGRAVYTCTGCGDTYEAVIPAAGHKLEHFDGEAPTCTTPGHIAYDRCAVCGYSTYCEIPADGNAHDLELLDICTEKTDIPRECHAKCRECGKELSLSLTSELLGAPILCLDGSVEGLSKENKVTVSAEYSDGSTRFNCDAVLKVQGATSARFEKKNYNIKFTDGGDSKKVTLNKEWGRHSKYCLKANYVDCTNARNVVTGRIYGQIVRSRGLGDEYAALPNGGATDGFPICLYLNGECMGLYTLNIPKDEWMFGMDGDGDTRQAIIKGAAWTESVRLAEHIAYDFSNGWDMVYCSTDDTDWVVDSFNKMMDTVNKYTGSAFKRKIANYINVDRAIDTYILTIAAHANDNFSKNVMWTTYDGVVWSPSIYDMDDSWGLVWNGTEYYLPTDVDFSTSTNRLWNKLATEFSDEIRARYRELRENILTIDNIGAQFDRFINGVPDALYAADAAKWKEIPSRDSNNLSQILKFVRLRFKYLDGKVK